MNARVDLHIVICTYQSSRHISACLDSVRQYGGVTRTVAVVDNDSTDGTTELVTAYHPGVRVIRMGCNAGYARAVNRGIAAGDARYFLVLNPDTVVAPDALAALVRFA